MGAWRAVLAAFLFVQLCLPGLQASMLRLAPEPEAHHGSHHGDPDTAPSAKHLKCAVCAAVSIPAGLPPPTPAIVGRAEPERTQSAAFVSAWRRHLPHAFVARAPPIA